MRFNLGSDDSILNLKGVCVRNGGVAKSAGLIGWSKVRRSKVLIISEFFQSLEKFSKLNRPLCQVWLELVRLVGF